MSETQYYYADGSTQRGPHTASEILSMNLPPQTLVWREGMASWQAMSSLPEFAGSTAASADQRAAIPPPVPPGHSAPPPYAQSLGYNAPPRDDSKRILAGVFALLMGSLGIHKFILGYTGAGLIMCLCTVLSCGFLGMIFGPIGIIEGIIYLTKSDEDFYNTYVVNRREWF